MNAFVTGAAGFIGSNLVDRLLAEGHAVTGYDNFSTGLRQFLQAATANPRFRLIEGDLLNFDAVKSAVAGADFEPEKDRPPAIGKRDRYTPRTDRVVLVLTASADAPVSTGPQDIRLVARPLVDGKPGDVLSSKTIPLMVLPKP